MPMDLSSYTGLQAAIADFLARDDLTAQIPGFIALAEAKAKREVRRKTVRTTLVASTESTALPADCAELRSIYPLTGSPSRDRPLYLSTPEGLAEVRARRAGVSGRPQLFAIIDGSLVLAPTPDQAYTLQISYYQKLVPLATASPNPLLTEAPDIYLYGALAEAAPYLEHDERLPVWKTLFNEAVESLDKAREREETNASYRPAGLPVVFG
jgi:hypothetical protein